MGDSPFLATPVAEEFRTGHQEDAPADEPLEGFRGSVDLVEQGEGGFAIGVEILEPVLKSATVVVAVDAPILFDLEVFVKVVDHAVAGHDAAGEEVAGHPIAGSAIFIGVGELGVTEDVEKKFAARVEPGADTLQQGWPVAHVFEHFDRDHAVKLRTGIEVVHIGGADLEIREAELCDLGLDVLALRS